MALAMVLVTGLLTLIAIGSGWLLLTLRPRSFALRLKVTSLFTVEIEMTRPHRR